MTDMINLCGGHGGAIPELEDMLGEAMRDAAGSPDRYYNYGLTQGKEGLREVIADMLGFKGIGTDNILITSSSQQGIKLAFDYAVSRTSSSLWIYGQEPGYFGALRVIKKVLGSGTAEYTGLRHDEDINSGIIGGLDCLVYVTSNFQNPTGRSLSEEEKDALANGDCPIIEDNPYDQLYYSGRQPSTIFERNPDKIIHIGSLSKIVAPGLRLGYIVASKERIKKLKSMKIDYDLFTSTICQDIAEHVLREGEYIEIMREKYHERRDACLDAMDRYLGDIGGLEWTRPEGGMFIWLKLPESIDYDRTLKFAEEQGVRVKHDMDLNIMGRTKYAVRLNFAGNPAAVTEEGIRRLGSAMRLTMRE